MTKMTFVFIRLVTLLSVKHSMKTRQAHIDPERVDFLITTEFIQNYYFQMGQAHHYRNSSFFKI